MKFSPIAIVGMGCVLPGCFDPDELWDTVSGNKVNISEAPNNYWETDVSSVSALTNGSKGGYVLDFDRRFSSKEFLLPNDVLCELDSIFKWTFFAAEQAIKDINMNDQLREKTCIILGNLSYPSLKLTQMVRQQYLKQLLPRLKLAQEPHWLNRFMSAGPAMLTAQALGFVGDAFCLDAACASSLYAIKLACDKLHRGEVEMAVAGGVCASESLFIHAGFSALKAKSPQGLSRPFNQDADGLVPAEGAAVVVLKRLDDAVVCNDNILGVIRAVGLSNDGRSSGFLVPSIDGQTRCIKQAFAMTNLSPQDVSYIECHATGTPLGDKIEIEAMKQTYQESFAVLSSLKSNLGHLITASGAASLIKVLCAMQHKILPGTPNTFPLIDVLDQSNFQVLEKAVPWNIGNNKSRIAGVSSFGFGGNNAHLIVEEWSKPVSAVKFKKKASQKPKLRKTAIVGIEIRTEKSSTLAELISLLDGQNSENNIIDKLSNVDLNIQELSFPPNDLKEALGQQLILLDTVQSVLKQVNRVNYNLMGVYVGFGVDTDIARYQFRYLLKDILYDANIKVNEEWLSQAKKNIISELNSAGVVGKMPNVPANRLNYQHDIKGPGFTLSAEELSGDHAFKLAVSAIACGEISSAIVASVELSDDAVHKLSIDRIAPIKIAALGKAAVTLILRDLEDARKSGDTIYAVVEEELHSDSYKLEHSMGQSPLYQYLGYAHVASGLLHIATAALMLSNRSKLDSKGRLQPILTSKKNINYHIKNHSVFNGVSEIFLSSGVHQNNTDFSLHKLPLVFTYSGETSRGLIDNVENNQTSQEGGPYRLAIVGRCGEIGKLRLKALGLLKSKLLINGSNIGSIFYREIPVQGKIAFVYTSAAATYHGMSRELLLGFPALLYNACDRYKHIEEHVGWVVGEVNDKAELPFYQLAAASFVCQVHTEISRDVIQIKPDAVLGLSSGETNMLYGMGVWKDIDLMMSEITDSELFSNYLGGKFSTVKQVWNQNQQVQWSTWHIHAPIQEVKDSLCDENKAYLTIIYTNTDSTLVGDDEACQRVISKLNNAKVTRIHHDLAVHCDVMAPFEEQWRKIHRRPVSAVDGVDFYFNDLRAPIVLDEESIVDALTGQALNTIDFRKTVQQAWDDGVRIFVEHGPGSGLTASICQNFGAQDTYVAIALDQPEKSFKKVFMVVAELWVAGVDVSFSQLGCVNNNAVNNIKNIKQRSVMNFPLKMPEIIFPSIPTVKTNETEIVNKIPKIAEVRGNLSNANVNINRDNNTLVAEAQSGSAALSFYNRMVESHRRQLQLNSSVNKEYLSLRLKLIQLVCNSADSNAAYSELPDYESFNIEALTVAEEVSPNLSLDKTAKHYPGPAFNRKQLEQLSTEKISSLFGDLFIDQDQYQIQCRLPKPPLLLCDRVLGIAGEAGSMSTGTIWTETDIKCNSWYQHFGYISPGIYIEAGQADLLLISWLGIDLLNKGERAYRLLGCELTYLGGLPKVGDTLHYEIHIDSHAQHGNTRLFFFHYDCYVDGELKLSVRSGQAGFFTPEELMNSKGVIWNAGDAAYAQNPRIDIPNNICEKSHFTKKEVESYSQGNMVDCFGDFLYLTKTHTRTPRTQSGFLNLIDSIPVFDVNGGEAGRGYLRAETQISTQDWFFKGHFKNDPCMPGTLMVEAAFQAMAFYLTALGFTQDKDGWRFEPVDNKKYQFICRGQVTPQSKVITYEIFVDEIIDDDYPTLFAHVLCSADGKKVFLTERLGIRLTVDYPITSMQDLVDETVRMQINDTRPVAERYGFVYDNLSLLNCSLGKPSAAFGRACTPETYDSGLVRSPRLPNPPYLFMSRIVGLKAEYAKPNSGSLIIADYDLGDNEAWYFKYGNSSSLPYAVLVEIALQPCGWLASFTLGKQHKVATLLFRNLDGVGTQFREIYPSDKLIRTESTLLSTVEMSGMVIVKFKVRCYVLMELVYELETAFGFFSPDALLNQKGLKYSDDEYENFSKDSNVNWNTLELQKVNIGKLCLPSNMLLMLDKVVYFSANAGKHKKGYMRAERIVKPDDWYFKAHFLRDPVQPGSLGIEALLQLVQFYMLHCRIHEKFNNPQFEYTLTDHEIEWHFRGQVTPNDQLVSFDIDIQEEGFDVKGYYVLVEARLWLGNMKIYYAPKLGLRLREALSGSPSIL